MGITLPSRAEGMSRVERARLLLGSTPRSLSDFPTILATLLTLPPETVVHTGQGDDKPIGGEASYQQ
jgi:hypothetical protein